MKAHVILTTGRCHSFMQPVNLTFFWGLFHFVEGCIFAFSLVIVNRKPVTAAISKMEKKNKNKHVRRNVVVGNIFTRKKQI